MRWRKISDSEIEFALKNPDKITKLNGKCMCLKNIRKRKLKIYFTIENNRILIISAFDKKD